MKIKPLFLTGTALLFSASAAFATHDFPWQLDAVTTNCNSSSVPGPSEVLFYQHDNFNGACYRVRVNTGQTYSDAHWVQASGVGIPNDSISSAKAGSNVAQVGMYRDAHLQGGFFSIHPSSDCGFTNPQDMNLGTTTSGGFNDTCVTSFNDAMSSFFISLNQPAW